MKKVLVMLILFAACKTEKGKIVKRQRDIKHEELTVMMEYYKEHKEKPMLEDSRRDFDKSLELTNKLHQFKKEYDSLQRVLDTRYADEK